MYSTELFVLRGQCTTVYFIISHSYRFACVNFKEEVYDYEGMQECLPKTLRLLDTSISTYSFTALVYVYYLHIF